MIRSLVAIFLMIVFAKAAAASSYTAMLMYWWYALFRPHDWMWWDIKSFRIPLIAAGIFVAYSFLTRHVPRFNNLIHVLLGVYAANVIGSQLATYCESPTELTYGHVLILTFVVLLTASYLTTLPHILALILAITLFFSFNAAFLGVEVLISGGTLYDIEVGAGTMSGTNAVSLAGAMTIFLCLPMVYLLRYGKDELFLPFLQRKTLRNILLVLVLFNILGLAGFIYGTDSRGSALALIAGGFFWLLLLRKRFTWISLAVLGIAAVFALGLFPESYYNRLSSAFAGEKQLDASAASRPHFWGVAHEMAKDRTLGVGVGCYPKEYAKYDPTEGIYGVNRSVHSSYFNILAELGYSGVFIWFFLQLAVFGTLWRARYICYKALPKTPPEEKKLLLILCNCLMASHMTFILGGVFYEFTYNDITWLTFVIAAACGSMALKMERDNVEEKDIFVSIYSPEHVRREAKRRKSIEE